MIADNKLTENASWDNDLLAKNFQILDELDLNFDLDITGFDYGEIENHLISGGESKEHNLADDIPALEKHAIVSRKGDIWQLADHKIVCADARLQSSYEMLLKSKKAHLVCSDPPYNLPAKTIGRICETHHGNFIHASGEMTSKEFTAFLSTVFKYCVGFSKPGSIHYLWMDWRHVGKILTAGNNHYHECKNICVWVKDRAGMGSFYRSQHEFIFVFKHGKNTHLNNFKLGQHGRYRTNVWHHPGVRNFKDSVGDVGGTSNIHI